MDTALPQKFPFILDRKLAKANCTENHVCTSCDSVVLDIYSIHTDLSTSNERSTLINVSNIRPMYQIPS